MKVAGVLTEGVCRDRERGEELGVMIKANTTDAPRRPSC